MAGVIVVIIVIVVAYFWKFSNDKNELEIKTQREGGVRKKYAILIDGLIKNFPNTKIEEQGTQKVFLYTNGQGFHMGFTIIQNFGTVDVQWKIEGIIGKYSKSWKFNEKYNQQNMLQEITNFIRFLLT